MIILAGNYRGGIVAMHALGHDDNADVANYIGYAYRRLGNYEKSKIWYEAALKADPNHVRTWSYYGMWQMEQGNRLKALDDLQKVKLICGNEKCEEFRPAQGRDRRQGDVLTSTTTVFMIAGAPAPAIAFQGAASPFASSRIQR